MKTMKLSADEARKRFPQASLRVMNIWNTQVVCDDGRVVSGVELHDSDRYASASREELLEWRESRIPLVRLTASVWFVERFAERVSLSLGA